MTLTYHVVEVCSTEVIAEVHLPDYELDFDRELLELRKGGRCSWGWWDVKHECHRVLLLLLVLLGLLRLLLSGLVGWRHDVCWVFSKCGRSVDIVVVDADLLTVGAVREAHQG